MDSLKGQLLLASAGLLDPNFHRTVVLIAEHSEEGAMGIVLNRPGDVSVGEATPPLEPLVGPGEPVFVGGPVEPATRRARVFAGYAGWTAGQLEAELAESSWIIEPALPEDVFAGAGEDLWSAVQIGRAH